jgi:hypothetical protein
MQEDNMKLHEVIYFTHELDLLEAHLEEHQHFVDKFFIKESSVFWTGKKKDLVFSANQERFARFNIELIIIPDEEFDLSIPTSFPKEEFKKWFDVRRNNRIVSRHYKWDTIAEGCDYVLSMDVDEIIDSRRADKLLSVLESKEYEHVGIKIQQSQYWVNVPARKLSLYRVFRSDIPYRDQVKGHPRTITDTLGWHFTNCYDAEGIRTKAIGITTHYGICGVDKVPDASDIHDALERGKDPFRTRWTKGQLQEFDVVKGLYVEDRVQSTTDLEWAPKYIRENPERFPFYAL